MRAAHAGRDNGNSQYLDDVKQAVVVERKHDAYARPAHLQRRRDKAERNARGDEARAALSEMVRVNPGRRAQALASAATAQLQ